MAKKNQHAKLGFGVDDPIDAIHMGEGKRIRLEDVPEEGSTGDQQVGNREYNDARYQPKGEEQATVARWIIPPVVQWTGSGYIFSTSQCSYELPGSASPIVANPTSKTLSSPDASFDRFDLFVWNDAGECIVIEGTPATEPIVPVVADPLTQIAGPFVLVKTGTTEPDPVDLTNTVIYNENTEWTGSAVGCTANFNNGVPVFTGFKSLEVSAIAINDYIEFTAPTDFNPLTFDSFGFQLRLKASMLTNQNLGIRFYDVSNVAISNERNITIEKGLVNEWQLSAVNIDSFAFNSNNARKIRIRWTRGTINHAGFYLDLVQLQGGIVPPVVAGTVVLTGQVEGSGVTGTPINVTVTEKFISDQTEQTDPLPANAMTTFRLSTGNLVKVPASLLFALGEDGREIELQVNATHIQWRYVGDPAWTDLIALTAITGPQGPAGADGANGTNGTDGREVELQVSGTNLQWRYVGDVSWTTIFDFTTLGPTLPTGGTTGQVLTKNSATDGDASWQDATGGATLGAEPVEEKFTYTSPAAQTFTVAGTPNGRPALYVNGQYLDWTFWAWDNGTKIATVSGVTLPDSSKVVLKYYSNLTGTAIGDAPSDGSEYLRKDGAWVNPTASYLEASHRENNTVIFDGDYIIGNVSARTGNILFDFTDAKLGAVTYMRHTDPSAFTFPTEAKLKFDTADISTVDENIFRFVITDITPSAEIVQVELLLDGGFPGGGGGASDFVDLTDVFSSYTGRANEVLVVNNLENGIDSEGVETLDLTSIIGKKVFIALDDVNVPSYTGKDQDVLKIDETAGKIVSEPTVELGITEVVATITENAVLQITYLGNTYRINVEKL